MTASGSGGIPFVGRARELAELRGWLGEAQSGRGRMIVLRGEPGMGKTRLVEDLHWADTATAAALGHLAAELRRSNALVLVTARLRAGSDSDSAPVAALLARPGVEQRLVSALDRAEIADYLPAVAGGPIDERYADLVLRQTAGNSRYVIAVARLPTEQVSWRSHDADEARSALAGRPELLDLSRQPLARVSAECRRMVEFASVAGEEFSILELSLALERSVQQVSELVDEAVRAGLIHPSCRPAGWGSVRSCIGAGTASMTASTARPGPGHTGHGPSPSRRATQPASSGSQPWRTISPEAPRPRPTICAHRSTPDGRPWAAWPMPRPGASSVRRSTAWPWPGVLRDGTGRSPALSRLLRVPVGGFGSSLEPFGSSLEHCRQAADLAENEQRWDLLARAALLVDGVYPPGTEGALVSLCQRARALVPEAEHSVRAQLAARLAHAAADDGDIERAEPMSTHRARLDGTRPGHRR